jgi:hypothetical protein
MNRVRIGPAAIATVLAFCILPMPIGPGAHIPWARAQGADDHAAAEALVKQLEADSAHRLVTANALDHAKAAFEQGARLRAATDEAHARAADGLAREWAETARDFARAAEVETNALDGRRKAVAAEEKLERMRALVEEAIARVGRLTAALDEADHVANRGKKAPAVTDGRTR